MSIFSKKSFLFPYLMIASTIYGIEQPKNQVPFTLPLENLHSIDPSSHKDSNSFLIPEQYITQYVNDNSRKKTSLEYKLIVPFSNIQVEKSIKNIITSLNNSSDITEYSLSSSHFNKFNYQLSYDSINIHQFNIDTQLNNLLHNQIFSSTKNNQDYLIENNVYLNKLLLVLLSIGLFFGCFIHYINYKTIISRLESFKNLFQFNNNCGFNSFWSYQSTFKTKTLLVIRSLSSIFLFTDKINKNLTNLFVVNVNHYSIP